MIRIPGAKAVAVRKPKRKMTRTNQNLRDQAASVAAGESVGTKHPVESRRAFRAALLLMCSLAGVYAWCAVRVYQASRFSASRDQVSLQRAIQLQPRDASNYDLLGQYFMWHAQDPQAAAFQFQQAVRFNPYASSYWLHLAQAENSLGNDNEQTTAIRNAIAVDPTTPQVAWDAANFFLVQGRTDEALDQLAVVVRNDPNMAEAVLDTSWRALGDVDPIQRRLPPDPEVYLKFIKLLLARQQWAAADHVWSSMLQLNREFDPRSALFYIDGLLEKRDVTGARTAWQQIADRSSSLKPYTTRDNLVVNANFDLEILNAAFDWHYSAKPGVAVMLDATHAYHGSKSLFITYSGINEDAGIWQYVPVIPGFSYVASAWVASEELQSANGPHLSIFDAHSNIEYSHAEETLGTTSWHRVETTFTAPHGVTLVLIRFSRQPAYTRIQGRFWVDDVRLSQSVTTSSER
jgi:cytochrome c-type biogenesis protein CcmH/NrfG